MKIFALEDFTYVTVLIYVQGGSRGQGIIKILRASPCPIRLDIMVLIFIFRVSGRTNRGVRGERVDEAYDTMKGRAIAGGFREEDIRWIRLSAEIKTRSSTSLRPDCAEGYKGYEFTLKNFVLEDFFRSASRSFGEPRVTW